MVRNHDPEQIGFGADMKKTFIAMAALPVVFFAGGYGAGQFLPSGGADAPQAQNAGADAANTGHAPDPSQAADAGNSTHAADTPPADAAAGHGAAPDTGHGAETSAAADSGHGAAPASGHGAAPADTGPQVVALGRMMIPVYKSSSVTYVVADIGVSVSDPDLAAEYMLKENTVRLRDTLFTSMTRVANGPLMAGAAINTDQLSSVLHEDLSANFAAVDEVLLLSFYKKDVPLS